MTDTEKVIQKFEEIKQIFNKANDEEAKKILAEIRWFQRIEFEL